MTTNKSVFLSWQSPDTRDWHVVGSLSSDENRYIFNYTNGAKVSKFIPFSGMEDINKTYISETLFPLFQNRLLSSKRPEYPNYLKWLGLVDEPNDPISILSRSGGLRGTDQLQMFNRIEFSSNGSFEHVFFAHGLGHLSSSANERVSTLKEGEQLLLCLDSQNDYDENAVIIRATNPAEIVGFCPRYLADEISNFIKNDKDSIHITVEMLSDNAPSNYRLMCRVTGHVNSELINEFMSNNEFKLINH